MKAFLLIALSDIKSSGLPTPGTDANELKAILSIVFAIVGALSFLMIVVSGLRYVLSGGNPERASKAKDGIIYALVGLVIALTAQAIVAFVIKGVK